MEIFHSRDGSELVVVAATWEMNPKITFESLAPEFRKDPGKAWRNYGSKVKWSVEGALKDPSLVFNKVNQNRVLPWDFALDTFIPSFRGLPGKKYFLHFDLSKNRDRTGIGLVHRERVLGKDKTVVDLMLGIEAKPGRNIDFADLRQRFVYDLTARGFHIELITFDGFQSEETRQVLESKQYVTDYESSDKSTEPYDTLIETLTSDTLDYYNYPIFLTEFSEIRLINGVKYDHPKKFKNGKRGTKDVSDAVACATNRAVKYARENVEEDPGQIKVFRPKPGTVTRRYYGD